MSLCLNHPGKTKVFVGTKWRDYCIKWSADKLWIYWGLEAKANPASWLACQKRKVGEKKLFFLLVWRVKQDDGIVQHVHNCDFSTLQYRTPAMNIQRSKYTNARCQTPSLAVIVLSQASIIASEVGSISLCSTILWLLYSRVQYASKWSSLVKIYYCSVQSVKFWFTWFSEGFNSHAQRLTPPIYLDVDRPIPNLQVHIYVYLYWKF